MDGMMHMGEEAGNGYRRLLPDVVTNRGNHARIQAAIRKAEDKPVTVAFLGGSVTTGYNPAGMIEENYGKLFCEYFQNKYSKNNDCICENHGFAAANSLLGLMIADLYVKNVRPDLVFLEYAINNGMDKISIASYESLAYKLLGMESRPAVIPVIVCNEDLYSCSGYMEKIARHYDLPVVNLYQVIRQGLAQGIMIWGEYSNDYGHPTSNGHRIIFEGIKQLFENINNNPDKKDYDTLEACFSRDFSTVEYFDHSSMTVEESGSFHQTDTISLFPRGWSYQKGTGNRPMEINLVCRCLFLIYEKSNSMEYGAIEILEDDTVISTIDSYSIYAFNNPDITPVLNEAAARPYRLKIRMRKGEEGKKFSILGFGIVYSRTEDAGDGQGN